MQPHPAVASPARQRTLNKPRPTSAAVSICTEHGLRQSSGSNPAAGAGGSPPWHLGWIGTGAGCEVERSQVGRPPAPSAPQPEGILPLFHVPRCFQPCWEMQVPCVPLLWTNNSYPNSGLLFWLLPMADPAGATESRPVVHRFILTSASPRSPELLL